MLLTGCVTVSSGSAHAAAARTHPVPLPQTTALFWKLFWTPAMGLTKQNTAASASPERISVGELRVITRFYPHASRPKIPCCRYAKG